MLEVLANAIRQEKNTNYIQIGKEEIKPSLSVDDMIFYIDNPKEYTKNKIRLLELISSAKTQNIRLTCKKSIAYLYMVVINI